MYIQVANTRGQEFFNVRDTLHDDKTKQETGGRKPVDRPSTSTDGRNDGNFVARLDNHRVTLAYIDVLQVDGDQAGL